MSSWFWNVKKWGEALRWPSAEALMQSVLFPLTKQMLSLGTLKRDHHFLMQLVHLKSGILFAPLGEPKATLFPHEVFWLPKQSHSPANVPQPGLQKPACASAYIWWKQHWAPPRTHSSTVRRFQISWMLGEINTLSDMTSSQLPHRELSRTQNCPPKMSVLWCDNHYLNITHPRLVLLKRGWNHLWNISCILLKLFGPNS